MGYLGELTTLITIGKFEFDFVTEVQIKSSWKKLTDTAQIILPRNLKWKDRYLRDEIKKGDAVTIQFGYDFNYVTEFIGYVTDLQNAVPVVIECEDAMWKLKQTNITKTFRSVTLRQLLSEILPKGTVFETVDANLGPFRINKVSAAKVLEELRKQYGFVSFFRAGKLYVGFPYSIVKPQRHELTFEEDIIKDQLNYKKKEDVKLMVRAVSMLPGGDSLEEEIGDKDGEVHSLHFYNLSRTQLKASATEESKRLRYEGWRGSFLTFGTPSIQHSDTLRLNSLEYPERRGDYLIDEVDIAFGTEGYRQEVTLGPSV